jgi:Uma2 family endonuclease
MATERDLLLLMGSRRKHLCELIDGVLVEKPPGFRESVLAGCIGSFLLAHVRPRNLGLVASANGAIRLWPGRVRIPDVSYFGWDRIPGRRIPSEPIPDLVPDLAVEVLSEGNTVKEMELKRDDYFRAGVRLYWEVDPVNRIVMVYTAPDSWNVRRATDCLDGGEVLPGFSISLIELFGELDHHG